MEPHPETGRRYIHVIPKAWGPFADIRAAYSAMSRQKPWLLVIDTSEFRDALKEMRDTNAVFVHWSPGSIASGELPVDRTAHVLPVYSEALDCDASILLSEHRTDLDRFVSSASMFDGFFAHTPWMVEQLSSLTGLDGLVLPVGWHPVMGDPDWDCPKETLALFFGSVVGRRSQILPVLERDVPLTICRGVYGPDIIQRMNRSVSTVYVAHSRVQSFSTWRIWQALCSSSVLVAEPGDWWPLTDEMCFELPRITDDTLDEAVQMLSQMSPTAALERARVLHESLRHFTTEFCLDNYVVTPTRSLSR